MKKDKDKTLRVITGGRKESKYDEEKEGMSAKDVEEAVINIIKQKSDAGSVLTGFSFSFVDENNVRKELKIDIGDTESIIEQVKKMLKED